VNGEGFTSKNKISLLYLYYFCVFVDILSIYLMNRSSKEIKIHVHKRQRINVRMREIERERESREGGSSRFYNPVHTTRDWKNKTKG
jgi:hypothetical protein